MDSLHLALAVSRKHLLDGRRHEIQFVRRFGGCEEALGVESRVQPCQAFRGRVSDFKGEFRISKDDLVSPARPGHA